MRSLNYDGDDSDSSGTKKMRRGSLAKKWAEKKKGKMICVDESPHWQTPINSKRRVSFPSPKNEIFFSLIHPVHQ